MNNRRRALIASASRTVPKTDDRLQLPCGPRRRRRCRTRHPSNGEGGGDLRGGLVGENTTRGPDRRRRNAAISRIGGDRYAQSLVWATAASSSAWPTVSSEQTGSASNGTLALTRHTCIVCFSNDSDGTRTRVRSAASFSLMKRRGQGLPGSARHDELPTIRVLEPLHHIADRFALMLPGLSGLRRRGRAKVGGLVANSPRR